MTMKELSARYNIGTQTISKWIKSGKLHKKEIWKPHYAYDIDEQEFLEVKKYYWNDRTRQSYKIGWDRDIFHKIDTPEKAYWLGFIMADGCIHHTSEKVGFFSIDISGRDVKHLEKFASFVGAKQNIIQHTTHSDTGNDLVHIQLSCYATVNDLENLGICSRKSEKEQWIDTPYPADFIRGYYDGDGYIKKDLHSIGLVGSYDLLHKIQEHFREVLGIQSHKIGKHGTIFRMEYCAKEDKKKIANYVWYDGCVSLQRKQELVDKIKKLC